MNDKIYKKAHLFLCVAIVLLLVGFATNTLAQISGPAVSRGEPYTISNHRYTNLNDKFFAEGNLYHQHRGEPNSPQSFTFTKTVNGIYEYYIDYCVRPRPPTPYCDDFTRSNTVSVTVVLRPPTPGAIFIVPGTCEGPHAISWGPSPGASHYMLQKLTGAGGWVNVINPAGADKNYYSDPGTGTTSARSYRVSAVATLNGHASHGSAWRQSDSCPGNTPPRTWLTWPQNNQVYVVGNPITLNAFADDPGNAVTYEPNVQFFHSGTAFINNDVSTPYSATWTPQQVGTFSLTSRAIDNYNATTTSAPVTVIVHALPEGHITQPALNTQAEVGSTLVINASATDADGITSVSFFSNGALIGTDTTAPYSFDWSVPSVGSFDLTVTATDARGAVGNSSPVVVVEGINPMPPANPPTNFSADTGSSNTTGSFNLSWDTVLNASEYWVQHCTEMSCSELDWQHVIRSSNRELVVAGLASGQHSYRVSACNTGGCSAFTAPISISVALPRPQRPAETWLKTNPVCDQGRQPIGTSTGLHTICWLPTDGSTHYEVQEKVDLDDWQTLPITTHTELLLNNKVTGRYLYRVRGYNLTDDVYSEYGSELEINVLDTPWPFDAAVACSDSCIQISGIGFDAMTSVEVTAIGTNTPLGIFSDIFVAVVEGEDPDTLQVPVDAAMAEALNAQGVNLKMINVHNNHFAEIHVSAGNNSVAMRSNREENSLANALAQPSLDSPPTVSHTGIIYIARDDKIYAYSPNGGQQPNWPVTVSGTVKNQVVLSPDQNMLYVATVTGELHALHSADSTHSGESNWQLNISAPAALATPVVDHYGFIYLGSMNAQFYSVDPLGYLRWSYTATAGIDEPPAIYGDDTITFSSIDGQKHTLRAGVVSPHLLQWKSQDDSRLNNTLIASMLDLESLLPALGMPLTCVGRGVYLTGYCNAPLTKKH